MDKGLIKDMLQDLIDLTEEIDWSDKTLPDIFEDDLVSSITNLAKNMYSIRGYQCWNNGIRKER